MSLRRVEDENVWVCVRELLEEILINASECLLVDRRQLASGLREVSVEVLYIPLRALWPEVADSRSKGEVSSDLVVRLGRNQSDRSVVDTYNLRHKRRLNLKLLHCVPVDASEPTLVANVARFARCHSHAFGWLSFEQLILGPFRVFVRDICKLERAVSLADRS